MPRDHGFLRPFAGFFFAASDGAAALFFLEVFVEWLAAVVAARGTLVICFASFFTQFSNGFFTDSVAGLARGFFAVPFSLDSASFAPCAFCGRIAAALDNLAEHDFDVRHAFDEGALRVDASAAASEFSCAGRFAEAFRLGDMSEPWRVFKTGETEERTVEAFAVRTAERVARQCVIEARRPHFFVGGRADESGAASRLLGHPRT
jgi:hypothetical protein